MTVPPSTAAGGARWGLPASTLKLIACLSMVVDHVGVLFFPEVRVLRIIGRLAFPIFAYFIAEGCRYTRHPLRRFLMILGLDVVCEAAYYIMSGTVEGTVLLTFALAIPLVHGVMALKRAIHRRAGRDILLATLGLTAAATVVVLERVFWQIDYDYGIFGVLLPVFLAALDFDDRPGRETPAIFARLDRLPLRLAVMGVTLLLIWWNRGRNDVQLYALPAILPLALYNGRPGRRGFKYGFYIFYPAHLVILWLIAAAVGA